MQRWGAALAVSVLLSGCLGGSEAGATAFELRTAAEAARSEPDSVLVGALTFEAADPTFIRDELSPPDWLAPFLSKADASVGDGRAHVWAFLFGDDATGAPSSVVLVDDSGAVMDVVVDPALIPRRGFASLRPTELAFDSPAVGVLGARSPTWDALASDPDAYALTTLLGVRSYGPVWTAELGIAHSDASEVAAVGAVSGTGMTAGVAQPFAPSPSETGVLEGTATATTAVEQTFEVLHAGHKQLRFLLDVPATDGGGSVDFVANGPAGESYRFWWIGSGGPTSPLASPNDQASWVFDSAAPGTWTVTATLRPGGTSQPFLVEWCAVGATLCA